jgi:hypothetical protein
MLSRAASLVRGLSLAANSRAERYDQSIEGIPPTPLDAQRSPRRPDRSPGLPLSTDFTDGCRFRPPPSVIIERRPCIRWIVHSRGRNEFYGSTKSGRNMSPVVSRPKWFGADNEDRILGACALSCRFGGGVLNDVIAVKRAR